MSIVAKKDTIALTPKTNQGFVIDPVYAQADHHPDSKFKANGAPLPGYDTDTIYVTQELLPHLTYAKILLGALSNDTLTLGIWDAWRPPEASAQMDKLCDEGKVIADDGNILPVSKCASYVSDISSGKTSGHTRGQTADVFIADIKTQNPISGTVPFDTFGRAAWFYLDAPEHNDLYDLIKLGGTATLTINQEVKEKFALLDAAEKLYFVMHYSGMELTSGNKESGRYTENWHYTIKSWLIPFQISHH